MSTETEVALPEPRVYGRPSSREEVRVRDVARRNPHLAAWTLLCLGVGGMVEIVVTVLS